MLLCVFKKLARDLKINLENLKASLDIRSIVDSAETLAEAKMIYDRSLEGSRLRAAAMKKRLEIAQGLITAFREPNTENDCHEHITYDEMELLCDMDDEELSDAGLDFVQYMDEKIDACNVCNRRYKFFINSKTSFSSFSGIINEKGST